MTTDATAIANEVRAALDEPHQIEPFSARPAGFSQADAYAVAAELRRLRVAAGAVPVGRKIGFTNRSVWADTGLDAPIWGDMYESTVRRVDETATVSLAGLSEPRIEPEIAFRLAEPLSSAMDESDILAACEWVAHGFEIVHSVFPGWRLTPSDAIAAGGVHAALLLGPPLAIDPGNMLEVRRALETFTITLSCDGTPVDAGKAGNVLGGPLSSLRHLVAVLAATPGSPSLKAGEVVTTGTLTRACPIAAGERWHTEIAGIALPGLAVAFA